MIMFFEVISNLFKLHKHEDIKDHGYVYCKTCGSPFTSLSEAITIMNSKKQTRRLNILLNKRKHFGQGIRVKSKTDHTRLPDPPGLTDAEETEYQILMARKFDQVRYF